MTVKELAKILKTSEISMRTWLSNYRFEQYREHIKPISYKITNEFIDTLEDFIDLKFSDFRINKKRDIVLLREKLNKALDGCGDKL